MNKTREEKLVIAKIASKDIFSALDLVNKESEYQIAEFWDGRIEVNGEMFYPYQLNQN